MLTLSFVHIYIFKFITLLFYFYIFNLKHNIVDRVTCMQCSSTTPSPAYPHFSIVSGSPSTHSPASTLGKFNFVDQFSDSFVFGTILFVCVFGATPGNVQSLFLTLNSKLTLSSAGRLQGMLGVEFGVSAYKSSALPIKILPLLLKLFLIPILQIKKLRDACLGSHYLYLVWFIS